MTLPLPFRNRAAIYSKRQRSLELEASAALALIEMAKKNGVSFVPRQVGAIGCVDYSDVIPPDSPILDASTLALINAKAKRNGVSFVPRQVGRIGYVDYSEVTPPSSPTFDASVKDGGAFESPSWQAFEERDPVGSLDLDEPPKPPNKRTRPPSRLPSWDNNPDPASVLNEPPKPCLEPPSKRARRLSRLPTRNNPADEDFVLSLHAPEDEGMINPVHVEIRRRVLVVRRTLSGSVFFQCQCCAHLPRDERPAKQSLISPYSIEKNLYQSFMRFVMEHVPACPFIPREIKEMNPRGAHKLKAGIKKYWVVSAYNRGLRNGGEKGIVYKGGEEAH